MYGEYMDGILWGYIGNIWKCLANIIGEIYDTLGYIIYGEHMIIIWGIKPTINLDDLAKLLACYGG